MDERYWPFSTLKPEADWTDFDRDYVDFMRRAYAESFRPREAPCISVEAESASGRFISLVSRGRRNGWPVQESFPAPPELAALVRRFRIPAFGGDIVAALARVWFSDLHQELSCLRELQQHAVVYGAGSRHLALVGCKRRRLLSAAVPADPDVPFEIDVNAVI